MRDMFALTRMKSMLLSDPAAKRCFLRSVSFNLCLPVYISSGNSPSEHIVVQAVISRGYKAHPGVHLDAPGLLLDVLGNGEHASLIEVSASVAPVLLKGELLLSVRPDPWETDRAGGSHRAELVCWTLRTWFVQRVSGEGLVARGRGGAPGKISGF